MEINKHMVIGAIVGVVVGILVGNLSDGRGGSFGWKDGVRGGYGMMGDWGKDSYSYGMHGAMQGMMGGLYGKTGDDFDKAFLVGMIVHHEGAIAMANSVLATSKRPELIKLANDIISAQTKEIEMMKGWKEGWFGN